MGQDQMCALCVMDTTDPDIVFDEKGVCNHCREAEIILAEYRFTEEQEKENLDKMSKKIRSDSKGEYNCIIGLSGGVDSSYLAYLAYKMGLNPLCVHFDNGWNSEAAVSNIKSIVETFDFDLTTYVIDWPEFRDLQRSFVKAGVIDIEMLTDHAIAASMFKLKREHKIRYVLSGNNYATEHGMPKSWIWRKTDLRNIKGIHKRYGTLSLNSFPMMTTLQWSLIKWLNLGGILLEPLNAVNYRKDVAMNILEKELGWRYYGGKHYESIFTKFYQAYILPVKFNVDKRKVHWSALIRNGEITRTEATTELRKPLYDPVELNTEKEFVLKKLGFSQSEFDDIMRHPPRRHDDFPTDRVYMDAILKLGKRAAGKLVSDPKKVPSLAQKEPEAPISRT